MRFLYPHTRPSKKCSACRSCQWHSWRHQTGGLKAASVWSAQAKPMQYKTWANKKAGRETVVSSGLGGPGCLQSRGCLKLSVQQRWGKRKQNCFFVLLLKCSWKTPFKLIFKKCNICSTDFISENSVFSGCTSYGLFHRVYLSKHRGRQVSQLTNAVCLLANLKPPNESLSWGRNQEFWFLIYGQMMMGWKKTSPTMGLAGKLAVPSAPPPRRGAAAVIAAPAR